MLRALLDLVLPRSCLACFAAASPRVEAFGLCPRCRGRLIAAPLAGLCAGCGRRLGGSTPPDWLCGACRRRPPAYERLLAGWLYLPPLDAVIASLKFRRLDYLGVALGRELAERLGPAVDTFDAVVPVPLHWGRRATRGYDQASEIGRGFAERAGLTLRPLLRRRRATRHQMGLPRGERLRNPRGAFRATAALAGARLLLIDDVATTGATLSAAAAALRSGGACNVSAAVVARTPPVAEHFVIS